MFRPATFLKSMLALGTIASMPVSAQTGATMEREVRALLEARLVDPGSLQLRNLKTVDGPALCGEFNAKNRMGGYNGFELFIYDPKIGRFQMIAGYYSDNGDLDYQEWANETSKRLRAGSSAAEELRKLEEMTDEMERQLMRCV